jgi:hypothetical protein
MVAIGTAIITFSHVKTIPLEVMTSTGEEPFLISTTGELR